MDNINVLIVGSTIHARQYVESYMFDERIALCFLPDEDNRILHDINFYGVKTIDRNDLMDKVNDFDIVIITNNAGRKLKELLFFKNTGFAGKYILEKPFSLNAVDEKRKLDCLCNNQYIVAYSRQIYKDKIKQTFENVKGNAKVLYWPNFTGLEIQIMRDTLPHVLDFLLILNSDKKFEIKVECHNENELIFYAFVNQIWIKVVIYNTQDNDATVNYNGVAFEWPNYFKVNKIFINKLYEDLNFIHQNNEANKVINEIYFLIGGKING